MGDRGTLRHTALSGIGWAHIPLREALGTITRALGLTQVALTVLCTSRSSGRLPPSFPTAVIQASSASTSLRKRLPGSTARHTINSQAAAFPFIDLPLLPLFPLRLLLRCLPWPHTMREGLVL